MLYVPLLFYLFDRLAEGREKAADAPPVAPAAAAAAPGGGGGGVPRAPRDEA